MELTPVRELGDIGLKTSSEELFFANLKGMYRKNIDFDVYLPSKGINLQRELVWTLEQKRELIYSMFLGRKIPCICVMSIMDRENVDNNDDTIQIIDGKQRLTTMIAFYNEEFNIVLEGITFYYSQLPVDYMRHISNYPILCQMAYEDFYVPFTDEDKVRWFSLINFAGTPQDHEHMVKIGCTRGALPLEKINQTKKG